MYHYLSGRQEPFAPQNKTATEGSGSSQNVIATISITSAFAALLAIFFLVMIVMSVVHFVRSILLLI